MMNWKKVVALLAMGGSTFIFPFGGNNGFGLGGGGCAGNGDAGNFYVGAGNASIAAFTDPARAVGGDFEAIVVNPTTAFMQALWGNWVLMQVPQDAAFANIVRQ
jgi:hypothetical protein